MIIEIKSDGNGTWNLVAKDHADAWPPQHTAYGRNRVQIEFLVRGILADQESMGTGSPTTDQPEPGTAPKPTGGGS